MTDRRSHLIGLLLGAEQDWPQALEHVLSLVGPLTVGGTTHELASERLHIHPFDLTGPVRPGLVIDRLAYWYYHPREWLKKAALTHNAYLLNNPFTFQAMEKHSAYCGEASVLPEARDAGGQPYLDQEEPSRPAHGPRLTIQVVT